MNIKQLFTVSALASALILAPAAMAASPVSTPDQQFQMWPGAKYSKAIPSVKDVLGYSTGDRITSHPDMLRYFEALVEAAPDRVKLVKYAETWEGRDLIYVAIGSQENIDSLDTFSDNMNRLADPRKTSKAEAKKLIQNMPSSVWLEHSVHGNEISSTDAAMMTAYHLLASQNDPLVDKVMANTLVFIDPLQNPDGRSRFIANYYSMVGLEDSADRLSVDQNEPWPRGRSNHYLFDMNRDWLAITQPETAGRIDALNHYKPTIVIDLHEMGGDSSYFFVPSASPINPHMQQAQLDNNDLIGRNNAKHFDRFGFDYFTREVYDAFYPGYGDSWPTFYGASAATYEVASTRGMAYRTKDGHVALFREPVQKHFVASLATLETAADNREKILGDFYQYSVNAIEMGKKDDEHTFIIPATKDRAGSHRLATLMAQHGVEVTQASEAFKACGSRYSEGAYVIDTAQPRGRFVKTTFTQQVDMSADFIKEQERRRGRKLRDQIYDVTAWSLPLLFNIDTVSCDDGLSVKGSLVAADDKLKGNVENADASVAYIVPWGDAAAGRFLTAALRDGISLKSADEAFTLDDKLSFPAGSLIVEVKANDSDIQQRIEAIAANTGALVTGVDSSWVIDGPSFGSRGTPKMVAPKIAMAWDSPTSSLSAGSTRFILERQFNYPVTAIRCDMLASRNLDHYQVLILPAGFYQGALGERGAANLKSWVQQGGVLITLGSATAFAAGSEAGLLNASMEYALNEEGMTPDETADHRGHVDGSLIKDKSNLIQRIENEKRSPDYVAGVLANVEVDQEHWLTAGVNPNVVSMVVGNDIYAPIKLDAGKNLAWFKGADDLLASGYLWKENQKQMAYKPFLMYQPSGKGMVISFTQDPSSRAFMDGLNVMMLNAVFRGAAHATPYR